MTYLITRVSQKTMLPTQLVKLTLISLVLIALQATCQHSVLAQQTNTFPATGNVGIGTTNPQDLFHIAGSGGVGFTLDTPGTAKGRVMSVPNIVNWMATTLNAKYTTSGWNLDETITDGWFFKLDARGGTGNATDNNGMWLFRIPAGPNPRVTEYPVFGVTVDRAAIGKLNVQYVPTSTLDIKSAGNSSASSALSVKNSSGVTTLFVRDDGRIGIGTTTPGTPLHIVHPGTGQAVWIDQYAVAPDIRFRRAQGTFLNPTATTFNNAIGAITAAGHDGTQFTSFRGLVSINASENWTNSAQGTFIAFYNTAAGSTTTSEKMRLDPSGNLGIGRTAPGFKLDVNGEVNATGFLINGIPISTGGGGAVNSVFGRTGVVGAAPNDYTWAQINKNTSSLADIATRSAGDLSSGTLPSARMPALTGDVTTTIGNVAATLANTTVTPGSYTNASITVDSKGRITTASSGGGGGSTAFSDITGATNTAALVVGSGGTLGVSGTGTITATTLGGKTFADPGTIGSANPGVGTFSTLSATTVSGNGSNLTNLNATNLASGTLPNAVFPATLPIVSGANLTALNANNLGSGTVPTARLGSGTANSTTFLRGDNTWVVPSGGSQWTTSGTSVYYNTGNVGLGTTNPGAKLEVLGDVNVTGTGNITAAGTITGGTINARYQDVAEWVPASHALPAGTVVTLDPTKTNHVEASSKAYDTRVAGVISARPGIALGERGDNKVLVATTGRVMLKVDASGGAIEVGDLLVTSEVPGLAMKSKAIDVGGVQIHRPGTLLGKALEPLAKGQGQILVLLSLQ